MNDSVNGVAPLEERFVILDCDGSQCVSIYSPPCRGSSPELAVVIVVGGPQYRVGSHRMFVALARHLAAAGIPVLRFDYRGMGDSDGDMRTFEEIDRDIGRAVDVLLRESGVSRAVLWGLCDGASAALMYAASDPRVAGVVAVNPWARTAQIEAQTRLRHYYLQRLFSPAFWRKLLARGVDVRRAGGDLLETLRAAPRGPDAAPRPDYLARMRIGLERFEGALLFLLSGRDHTAREFETWLESHPSLTKRFAAPETEVRHVRDADHTFSAADWRSEMSRASAVWVHQLGVKLGRRGHAHVD